MSAGDVLFGYRQAVDVPPCPCGDCGRYMMAEATDQPLVVLLRTWCGYTTTATADSPEELAEWLAKNRG